MNKTVGKIKYLQLDIGTEHLTNEFEEFLKTRGLQRRLAIPDGKEWKKAIIEKLKAKKWKMKLGKSSIIQVTRNEL